MNRYKSKFEESKEFNGRKIDGVVFSVNTIKQLLDEGLEDFMPAQSFLNANTQSLLKTKMQTWALSAQSAKRAT